MPEPKDLPKAKDGVVVVVSTKTWNLLVDVVTAAWPLAGEGILINQLPDGRAIRVGEAQEGSDGSSSDSSSSSESSSSSDSSPSSGSPSSGPPSGPSGPGSSKDCVVRFGDEFIRWHCVERPDVVFEDVVEVSLEEGEGRLKLAPEMVESCEPGSIRATAVVTRIPALHGVWVEGDYVHVQTVALGEAQPDLALVTIEGIRKGFTGKRWEAATEAEAIENARVWQLLNGQAVTV